MFRSGFDNRGTDSTLTLFRKYMSQEPTPPNPGQPRELNLQKTANHFMTALQRHFDMLAFNLASRENTSEAAYNAHVRAAGVMPVPQVHQNFEQMQAHARDLMVRQVINDALNLAVSALHNAHLFLSLIQQQKASGNPKGPNQLSPDQQKEAQQNQEAFLRLRLEEKFDALESAFGVVSEFEDTFVSLAFCLKALSTQGGIVKQEQVDDDGFLALELISAAPSVEPVPDLRDANIQSNRKAFRVSDRVIFSDNDLLNILLTLGVFARRLFSDVARYAAS